MQLGPAMHVSACESNSDVLCTISLCLFCALWNLRCLTCATTRLPEVTQVLVLWRDMNEPAESVLGLLSPTAAEPLRVHCSMDGLVLGE